MNQVVERHREALEIMKFAILEQLGANVFTLLQGALDHYYQDTKAPHLACHIHFKLFSHPLLHRPYSQYQSDYLDEYLAKSAAKEMRKLERDFNRLFDKFKD
ncbi:hypothetical protein CGJ44_08200 [Vibrio parahaemolyticus]|nr:hypothetical protein CGJ44_08200 [Vibrio parahaemolyticus]